MLKNLTKKNSTTGNSKTKSQILILGIILIIVLIGFFSSVEKVNAEETEYEKCAKEQFTQDLVESNCKGKEGDPSTTINKNFEEYVSKRACMTMGSVNPLSEGCLTKLFYSFFHGIPAFLLWVSGMFFNILLSVSLSSDLLKSAFVGQAWGIVRDFSNIFFILILLYIAIKVILGIGGSEVKKMIVNVIIIALLINFSMFFTTVIIDSSNILALIFYNKMSVDTKSSTGTERPYSGIGGEKDISGGLVNSFDPTQMVGEDFFKQAKKQFNPKTGEPIEDAKEVPFTMILSVILISGAVMCFAAYVLFISGIFFLGRLIELWILIIFSPFAFVSSSVPQLSAIQDIGWKAWFSRLLSSAFMAPIFLFFLYFIFMLVSNKAVFEGIIPKSTNNSGATGMIKIILGVVLPSILICVLLIKAKNYAKRGAGEIGGMVMTAAKMAGGVGLAAVAGSAAYLGRQGIGRIAANVSESNRFRDWAANTRGGQFVSNRVSGLAGRSFDIRGAKIGGQTLASATGMKVGEAQKGGFAKSRADAVKRDDEFVQKQLDTSDYGKAELSRGGMDVKKAGDIIDQIEIGAGRKLTNTEKLEYQMKLTGHGIEAKELANVSRHLNAARRNTYADRKEKRTIGWGSKAGTMSAKNRMTANKVRADLATLTKRATLADVTASLAAAGGSTSTTPTPTPPTPTTPAGGGGGTPHP
ncbi:MAG: hypothetical protein WCW93_03510 [Candidatus Paceibacterota bacterium]